MPIRLRYSVSPVGIGWVGGIAPGRRRGEFSAKAWFAALDARAIAAGGSLGFASYQAMRYMRRLDQVALGRRGTANPIYTGPPYSDALLASNSLLPTEQHALPDDR